jgi:hypothetical protein
MKKKTQVMLVIAALMVIGFSVVGFMVERNCCNADVDCCCADRTDEGMALNEYLCICSQGGHSFVVS